MVLLKNNRLKKTNSLELCKPHNDKKVEPKKIKLSTHKIYDVNRLYHPLKNKKIRWHRLRFVRNICIDVLSEEDNSLKRKDILSRRYRTNVLKPNQKVVWANEDDVIGWLASVGIGIKCIAAKRYIFRDRVCSINHIMIAANKKRLELGLDPFYVEGVTEF